MATPFVYTATVSTTPKHEITEDIPVIAFSTDINYSSWDSISIEREEDLKRVEQDALSSGWIILAVPLGELEKEKHVFESGSHFEFITLFANDKPEDAYNATAQTAVRGHLKVEFHGKIPQNIMVPAMDPYRYKRFVQDKSKGPHWLMPQYVRISVKP